MKTLNAAECVHFEKRLRRLRPEARAGWGRMSAAGMICHLTDAFCGVMGERGELKGMGQRMLLKYFALYVPLRWPAGVSTVPEAEQGKGGTPPGNFDVDRDGLLRAIERFCRADLATLGTTHPIFGTMTLWEWRRWGWLHVDHHLRQFGV